ncbi:MAG: type I-G CRISPR-associated helicase/endonuclease Cas3g [Ramlibacter sp.]
MSALNSNDRNQTDPDVFFRKHYLSLTGDEPFPWQRKLFAEFTEGTPRFRAHCPVPTGLGKTSVLTIWLLALAYRAMNGKLTGFPRRLAYVVNRRTVVDQATTEAEKLRAALTSKVELRDIADALRQLATEAANENDAPLAISTLRGELADNGEWRSDPARPAIVIGTIDMIGSRLLFSGYGRCGFKSKPLHAGLLGQDTLLVHDEAHLEPAFQKLLETIATEQARRERFGKDWDKRALRVMALTATTRAAGETAEGSNEEIPLFGDEDKDHREAGKRLNAKKWLDLHPVQDDKHIAGKIVEWAMTYKGFGKAVLIFLRRLEDVEKVASDLRKKNPDAVQTLTGTQRGFERDRLAKDDPIFARFLPAKDRRVQPKEGTVYLVCTSAGEVGVNLSADHLVCDLTPLDSMVQRFGRVNRLPENENQEARIEIVHVGKASSFRKAQDGANADAAEAESNGAGEGAGEPDSTAAEESKGKKKKPPSAFDLACQKTFDVLRNKLQEGRDSKDRVGRNASPAALNEMLNSLSPEERDAAFTPLPVILPATDILFDAWAMTTVRGKLPVRPPVADYLHGIRAWEPPETYVAWREEVSIVTGELLESDPPEELLEDFPLKPHEQLRARTDWVFEHLKTVAKRAPDFPVWLLSQDDELQTMTLAQLVEGGQKLLEEASVILPPAAGGLTETGTLDGGAAPVENDVIPYDIADEWRDTDGQPRRQRVWGEAYRPARMRLVRRIDLPAEADVEDEEEPEIRSWFWYARPRSADDDGSRVARQAQGLKIHLESARGFACRLVKKLFLEESLARAVVLAARWHDLGKNRRIWQRSIGNRGAEILAKSGPGMKPLETLTRYRHEFGSLLDVTKEPEFQQLDEDARALVLHLIAAHHGRARPHFPIEQAFDPCRALADVQVIADQVPQLFGRLQRRYGRWGLAWLESLVRAADAMASNAIHESYSKSDVGKARPQEQVS